MTCPLSLNGKIEDFLNGKIENFCNDSEIGRQQWQNKTVEAVKSRLNIKDNEGSYKLNTDRSEKIVAVYGSPQIGKTTLILYLIGINEGSIGEVYDILRAEIARGNSSTSTAIMYSQSKDDNFGMLYDEKSLPMSNEIKYFSQSKDFKAELKNVRKKVEEGKYGDGILHIYIPKRYFCAGGEYSNINILDLPGMGSRNKAEERHTTLLINRYARAATVNIIVCKANCIESLKDIKLPVKLDWWSNPLKYMIVLTNSFAQESIWNDIYNNHFKIDRKNRQTSFKDLIDKKYKKRVESVFKDESCPLSKEMDIYPIDIGDSLKNKILKNKLLKADDKKEVTDFIKDASDKILASIQERKGNSLKTDIEDLRQYSITTAEQFIKSREDDIKRIKESIENNKRETTKSEESLKELEKQLKNGKDKYERSKKIEDIYEFREFSKAYREYAVEIPRKFWQIFGNKNFKDKDKTVCAKCSARMKELAKTKIKALNERYPLLKPLNDDEVYKRNIFAANNKLLEMYKSRGFFQKLKSEQAKRIIEDAFKTYAESADRFVTNKIEENKKAAKEKIIRPYEFKKVYADRLKKEISDYEADSKRFKAEKNRAEKDKEATEKLKNDDVALLNDYLKEAKKQYVEQQRNILNKMKKPACSKEDMLCYFIYLGILENDYNSIIKSQEVDNDDK